MEFMDQTLHENYENCDPTKIKPSTVLNCLSPRSQTRILK